MNEGKSKLKLNGVIKILYDTTTVNIIKKMLFTHHGILLDGFDSSGRRSTAVGFYRG